MVNFLDYRKNIHEEESKKVPTEAVFGRVKALYDSGRYDITPEHDYDGKGSIEFHAIAKRPAHAEEFQSRKSKNQKNSWHDPKISTLHTPHPEDEFPRTHAKLKPDSGYTKDVQDKPTKGVLFRGMSHEEFHGIQKSGKIQSKGALNMGMEQEGLTYYSRDPSQAQSYAHSFAHAEHKATGQHHAYVVAVKDPGTEVKVKGTGENEVGIPHAIKKEDILHVHIGRAYHGGHGSESSRKTFSGFESGSGSTPDTSVGWKKLTKTPLAEKTEELMIDHNGGMVHRNNSSGNKIHSSESGIKSFHDWFSGSTTVDQHNRPHVFYHGTSSNFDQFKSGSGNQWGAGHYFVNSPKVASEYSTGSTTGAHARIAPQGNAGANVMPVYLKMKRPFVMDEPMTKDTQKKIEKHLGQKLTNHTWAGMKNRDIRQVLHHQFLSTQDAANHVLKKAGFDGIREKADDSIHMVFDPNQIKSSIGNSGKFSKDPHITESDSYQGEHSAPDHENGMPAHNLTGMYPDDIHTLHDAARHYGDQGGSAMDHESISVIHHVKDKPNRLVKIYRAVPKVMSHEEKLDKMKLEMAHHMRYGRPHPSTESTLTGSAYYNQLHKEHKELSSKPAPTDEAAKIKMNKGDWVTTSKAYAVDHGKSNLKNKYRIISKTVKAKEIFNDGNSIHEWGYHPHVKENTGYSIADIYLNEVYEVE